MIKNRTVLVLFLLSAKVSESQRRIIDGRIPTKDKTYVVYIFRAFSFAAKRYSYWLCGGALVTTQHIVTSASCVIDVEFMFVVAGYRRYVSDDDIIERNSQCIKNVKRKIVYFCTPKSFEMEYNATDKWSKIDIAVARLEKPYELNDPSFKKYCSYNPTTIPINFEAAYQRPGLDVFVVGWGHNKTWRDEMDIENHNQKELLYTSCIIENKQICQAAYAKVKGMDKIIERYMICTSKTEKGNLDDRGVLFSTSKPTANGCDKRKPPALRNDTDECRRSFANSIQVNITAEDVETVSELYSQTRRNGFCQNDHGGPLVTWVGKRETLIGVASVFMIDKNRECVGPFLYTSTQCNGAFLDCALTSGKGFSRRFGVSCKDPPHIKGFDQVERTISWTNHPDGPADSERDMLKFYDNPETGIEEGKNTSLPEVNTQEEEPSHSESNAGEINKAPDYVSYNIGKSVVTIELKARDDNIPTKKQAINNKTNNIQEQIARYIQGKAATSTVTGVNITDEKKVLKNEKSQVNKLGIYTVTIKVPVLRNQKKQKALSEKAKVSEEDTKTLIAKFAARDVYTATIKIPLKENDAAKNPHPLFDKYFSRVHRDKLTKIKLSNSNKSRKS